jgi:hypothetical protein
MTTPAPSCAICCQIAEHDISFTLLGQPVWLVIFPRFVEILVIDETKKKKK